MTPLHIVMIGVPAHGHMNPHLPVLAELVARGHRVDVTTPAGFAPAVAGTGATVVPVTSVLPDEDRGETWPDDPVAGMARFLDEGVHVLPQARAALRRRPARRAARRHRRLPGAGAGPPVVPAVRAALPDLRRLGELRAGHGRGARRPAGRSRLRRLPRAVRGMADRRGRPPRRRRVHRPAAALGRAGPPGHATARRRRRPAPLHVRRSGPGRSAPTRNSGPSRTARCCWSRSARPTPRRPRSTAPASTPSPTSTATSS